MKGLVRLAIASAWHRRGTLALVLVSIALAAALLVTIERVRHDVRANFVAATSGTDLVVGARTAPLSLLLYAVFRIGGATNEIAMSSVRDLAAHPAVAWTVPIALGDSHAGFPVVGTTRGYFEHFRHGDRQPLVLDQGRAFAGTLDGLYEAVVGADVAAALAYRLGDRIVLTHGIVPAGALAKQHDDKPFTIVGILARTGTPVDRSLHVSLQAITALHLDWIGGAPLPGVRIGAEAARKFDLEPKRVTAVLVGLQSRAAVFTVQRFVAGYAAEPLVAVLPGVALDELWTLVGAGERVLLGVSALVAATSLAGLVAVVLAGLEPRRRELAVLRAVGAAPRHVLALLAAEGAVVTAAGVALGAGTALLVQAAAAPFVLERFGIALRPFEPLAAQGAALAAVLAAGILAGLLPAWRAYRLSLADGLAPRA
jgi:putative ABC transport system permease protein